MQINYTIEEGFDFWKELNNSQENYNNDTLCLITKEPLTPNHITLPCGHQFNYTSICMEMVSVKYPQSKYSQNVKLNKRQTCCPYCRKIFNTLLPYIPIYNLSLPKYICSSTNCLDLHTCTYRIKCGKHKGNICDNRHAFETNEGTFCIKHYNGNEQKVSFVNEEAKQLFKQKTIPELKKELRSLHLSCTGRKHVLVNRIINNGLLNSK